MDWINDLSTKLEHSFVFPNGGSEPIVIKNPIVQFRWRTIFITGEVAFSTFENIVDDEIFNFDIDFVRPMQGGSMMLVGKPVQIKLALEHSVVYRNFDIKMRQDDFEETLQRLLSSSESESDFLLQYHWMVLSMSQNQKGKEVGHETIWNLIDYDDDELMENWDDLVGAASLHFVQQQGLMDDFKNDIQENDFSPDDLSQIFNQAKEQLMDKDNPMGNMLSNMFGGNNENFQDALSESMNQMMGMFGGMNEGDDEEDEGDEEDYLIADEVIVEHLEMLEIPYEKEGEDLFRFIHKSELTGKSYECSVVAGEDYLNTVTTYDTKIPKDKWSAIYRLLNGLNYHLNFGKLIFIEAQETIVLRTELPNPIVEVPEEPITDMMDENWVCSNEAFNILDYFLEGKLTYEQAIEEAEDSFL